jgi:hypothetical protein
MKNLLILIALILIVAFTGQAKAETKKLVGELVNEGDTLAVYTINGRVTLHSDAMVDDCFAGEYEVAVEPKGDAQFKLVDTVICRGKTKKGFSFDDAPKPSEAVEKFLCPMIYAPVCGVLNGVPQTFGNTCELTNAKASKLFLGACEQAISAGVKGHQDLTSFEIHF